MAEDFEPSLDPETRAAQNTSAIAEIRGAASVLLERLQWMRQAGITFEGQRDLYEVLGYARLITNRDYRDRYARGGLAKRIVDAMPDATWRGGMELVEDEDPKISTPFETAWKTEDKRLNIVYTLQRADKLAGLSTYAVILLGAPGLLQDELPKGKLGGLLFMSPFSGGGGPNFTGNNQQTMILDADAMIKEYELDTASPRYGLPKFYQLRRINLLASENFGPTVHWSRIIHIAEGCLDDEVFGVPTLESVWNLLDDLDKVTGGGAEAFWLRANQGFHINFDKDMKEISPKQKTELQESLERFRHGIDRFIRTRGTEVTPLGSDVANFSNPADGILTQIAGSKKIPKRILTGSEMGELASSQDRDNWKDQINGRQTTYAAPFIVRRLVGRLITYGYLPTPAKGPDEYAVEWSHMQVMTEDEKASGAQKWASVNQAAGVTVFSAADIRDHWYGMEEGDSAESEFEMWRANGAEKWATINKTMGVTVFTDDEIRKIWYGYDPLAPEQKQPVQAPERVSATAPTPLIDEHGKPVPQKMGPDGKPMLGPDGQPIIAAPPTIATDPVTKLPVEVDTRVGLPAHQTHGLSDDAKRKLVAKVKNDAEVKQQEANQAKLDAIAKAPAPPAKNAPKFKAAEHTYSTVQVNLPPRIADKMLAFGNSIPDEDLAMPDGREDQPHVTVKYGLHTDDPNMVRLLLRPEAPVDLTLGESNYFETPEYDVVYVEVNSACLENLNELIASELATTTTFAQYVPHATIAYVKPGLGPKYAGVQVFDGLEATINEVSFNSSTDQEVTIPLTGGVQAAEIREQELLNVLEEAIKHNATDVVDRILGMRHAEPEGHDFHGNQYVHGSFNPFTGRYIEKTALGYRDTVEHKLTGRRGILGRDISSRHAHVEWFGGVEPTVENKANLLRVAEDAWQTTPQGLVKTFTFKDRRICATFIATVLQYANTVNHHPDVLTVPNGCQVTWVTHSADDTVTDLDRQAAERTDAIAQGYRTLEEEGHSFHGNQWTGGLGGDPERGTPPAASLEDAKILAKGSHEFKPMNSHGGDSQGKFSDSHGHYQPDRQELHDAITRAFTQGITPVDNPTVTILGGGMASGKTTVEKSGFLEQDPNTVKNNVDLIRPMLPELREAYASGSAKDNGAIPIVTSHEEASDISRQLLRETAAARLNMILDGTGDTTLEKLGGKVAELRARGYAVNADYVTVPVEKAIARAAERAKGPERREVPETDMRAVHKAVSQIYPEAIRQGLFDKSRLWSTDVARGEKPILIASSVGRDMTIHNQQLWNDFLEKGRVTLTGKRVGK